jgi:hypothetical protein
VRCLGPWPLAYAAAGGVIRERRGQPATLNTQGTRGFSTSEHDCTRGPPARAPPARPHAAGSLALAGAARRGTHNFFAGRVRSLVVAAAGCCYTGGCRRIDRARGFPDSDASGAGRADRKIRNHHRTTRADTPRASERPGATDDGDRVRTCAKSHRNLDRHVRRATTSSLLVVVVPARTSSAGRFGRRVTGRARARRSFSATRSATTHQTMAHGPGTDGWH